MNFQTKQEDIHLLHSINSKPPTSLPLLASTNGYQQPLNSLYPLQSTQLASLQLQFLQANNGIPQNSNILGDLSTLPQQLLLLQQQQQQQQNFQQNINIQMLVQQMQSRQQGSQQQLSFIPSNFSSLQSQQQSPFSFPIFLQQQPSYQQQISPALPQLLLLNQNLLQLSKQTTQSSLSTIIPSIKQEHEENDQDHINILQEENEDEDQMTAGQDLLSRKNSAMFNNSPLQQQQQQAQQLVNKFKELEERTRSVTTPIFFSLPDLQIMQTPISSNKQEVFTQQSSQFPTLNILNHLNSRSPLIPEFQFNHPSSTNVSFSALPYSKDQILEFKKQMGITVRDKETLASFLEEWNLKQESEQVISKSNALLKRFSSEGSGAYENEFKVEYVESFQKCNYINKFINSKGLIVKDDKLGKIKIENKISRFHNLSRLLMYTILTAFHKNNLALMNLDSLKQEAILNMIQRLKQSARKKTPKGLIKTDFFNHTHYNVLFLTINEQNIDHVSKNHKDISTHLKVFNVDLRKPFIEIQEELRYSNIVKKLAYHIMLASYKKSKEQQRELDLQGSSNSSFREQYIDRAMMGIGKLNQGVLIQRF